MTMQARYIQRSSSIDFRPQENVQAGDIIVINGIVGVAKIPIKAGVLGSIALTGVFDVTKSAKCSFSTGAQVYWDNVRKSAVTSGDTLLGLAAKSCRIDDESVMVILNSGGVTIQNNNQPESNLFWQTIN